MEYQTIKQLHVTFAALSGSLFILRGAWMMRDSILLQHRIVKIVPHIIDTALLASALTMVMWSEQYPFIQNWLTVKVLALVVYIALGTIALKRGRTKRIRVCAFMAAATTFMYIGIVATTKQVLVFT